MKIENEIAGVILEIVETGLLRIRSLAWSGRADRCAVEADHIHNLSGLLADYSPEKLAYYWDVERTAYLCDLPAPDRAGWESLWERLRPHVELLSTAP